MARAIDQHSKDTYMLVRFTYGDASTKAYTNWTRSIAGTPTFASTPAMTVTLPKNTGTLDDEELAIVLPRDTFTDRLSSGVAHSPCYVEVWETIDPVDGTDEATLLQAFKGPVTSTLRHPNGQRNQVEIRSQLRKCRLKVPMGLPANEQCLRTLGVGLCHATRVQKTGLEVVSVTGRILTVASLDTTSLEDRHFHRGYLVFDSLRLSIRDWRLAEPTQFLLTRQAPSEWVGEGIIAESGCDKSIETCRRRYSAEDDFFGIGYSIPAYTPLLEDGA
jgi:hypothetical protein